VVFYVDFGRNFIRARKRKGMDQKDASAKLEVSPGYLSRIENGKQKPSIDLIMNAAALYGVSPGFFFEEEVIDINSLYSTKNKAFIQDLNELSDEDLLDKYQLRLDGKELTPDELKGIMAYIRSLRSMED
jgi:transcriptional regulator with XRE-family HTH domain